MNVFLYWAPRILSLAFVAFLSIFALDVFEVSFEPMLIVGFLVHLLPSFVLLGLTLVAWRMPLVGAMVFCGFAILYVVLAGLDRPWSWYAAISLPSLVIGVLYLADWLSSRKRTLVL